jgi:hypothetical protein
MPINQLVNFCYQNHIRPERCGECPNVCQGNCIACLESIHQVGNQNRTYNCNNIIYCYTCNYIYKYSSEIEYLLNQYVLIFRNTEQIRMWSIGCGPCTELFGLYNFRNRNNLNFNIQYHGFDLNNTWAPIHNFIQQMGHFESHFHYENIFHYFERTDERPNIVVLNYLISDILRTNRQYIDQFITDLCNFINTFDKCLLIVNDINLGQDNTGPRYYYNQIRLNILQNSDIITQGNFHFVNSQRGYWRYGTQHVNNAVTTNPPNHILERYSSWTECRSAQLIIFKKARQ